MLVPWDSVRSPESPYDSVRLWFGLVWLCLLMYILRDIIKLILTSAYVTACCKIDAAEIQVLKSVK
jgi:hypothetical protein